MQAPPEVAVSHKRGRGRPPLYPGTTHHQIHLTPEMGERLWLHIKREPLTPFVREALTYYLDALEAGRVTRPGK